MAKVCSSWLLNRTKTLFAHSVLYCARESRELIILTTVAPLIDSLFKIRGAQATMKLFKAGCPCLSVSVEAVTLPFGLIS
jgi:hypothetical protein